MTPAGTCAAYPGQAAEHRRPELALVREGTRGGRIGSRVRCLRHRIVDRRPTRGPGNWAGPREWEIRRCRIGGIEHLHAGVLRRAGQQLRELRDERRLVLEQVPYRAALKRRRIGPWQHVEHNLGHDPETAQRHPRKLQRRPSVRGRRCGVDRRQISICAKNRERRGGLGKDWRFHRAAVDVYRGHPAEAEEPTGGDRLEHQVVCVRNASTSSSRTPGLTVIWFGPGPSAMPLSPTST